MTQALRSFALSLCTFAALSACGGGAVSNPLPAAGIDPIPPVAPEVQAGMDAWVAGFRGRALAQGISEVTLNRALGFVPYNPKALEAARNQAEFEKSLWEYLDSTVSNSRVAMGRAKLSEMSSTLAQIEATYGVDREAVAAVWGMESNYGSSKGRMLVVPALATLAQSGYRSAFFEQQLIGALKIIQAGDVDPAKMTGSWAGAMGHTQFIPTSYLAFAVDFTGDGRRDIWSEDPSDALASTAAYLKRSGWVMGQPALVEVTLPAGMRAQGKGVKRSPSEWAAMGVRAASGGTVPDYGPAAIIEPEGPSGSALMIFRNFNAILRYNNADAYAIGVGHLAERLKGGEALRKGFVRDPNLLDEGERIELQQRLTAQGFDTGGTDGRIGAMTRAAISAFQSANGLPADGQPTQAVLSALR